MNILNTWIISAALAFVTFAPIPAFADGHAAEGERVFKRCISCHAIGPEAGNKVGPPLNGIIGRIAGSLEGFRFSPAMIATGQEGLVWDAETLDAFMTRPNRFIRGTRMRFSGLRSADDRASLIAFLETLTPEALLESGAQMATDPALPPEIMALVGDVAYGQYLGSTCVTCHQLGNTESNIPSIIGWPAPAMVTVLHAYKNKDRSNAVMQQQTGTLSNEEIAALAAYFETLE